MRVANIARLLAPLLFFFAALAGIPLAVSLVDPAGNPHGPVPWLATIALGWTAAAALRWVGRRADPADLLLREGLALTALFWFGASLIAAVGIHLGTPPSVTWSGSLFEAVSGLTTTGSSVLGGPVAPKTLDPSLLLWRSLLQWLGGIGIVVMALTLLPMFSGGGGFALFRSEVPGIRAERLVPRIAGTARILVLFYLALTATVAAGLLACGIPVFDAINHAMTTVSTGGFSTHSDSVEGLRSPAAEWVIVAGMYLAALDFGLMLRSLARRPDGLFASTQWRWFTVVLIAATAFVALVLARHGRYANLHDLVRDSAFQVVSLGSSTGFGTGYDVAGYGGATWEAWPVPAVMVILALMAVGGCTGSTAGGFKFARLLVLVETVRREVRLRVDPRRIVIVRLDGRRLGERLELQVIAIASIAFLTWGAGTASLVCLGHDATTAATAMLTSISNMGPGLGSVGPAENFHHFDAASHCVCAAAMLLGRLEFFSVLMVLTPGSWRR